MIGRRRPAAGRRALAALVAGAAALGLAGCGSDPVLAPACTTAVPDAATVQLDPEQAANAATIAAVGRRLGLPAHAATVALATAMQESKLRNLSYGDRDSLGLFQQRPSQGWGTREQVSSPAYAAAAFYGRLVQVEDWQDLPVTVAAQAVQRSAFPEAYARHEGSARTLARATTGQVPAGLTCAHLDGASSLAGEALQRAAAAELGRGALQADSGTGLWAAATWVVAHASEYGVTSVQADGRRWTADAGAWAPDPQAGRGLAYA